MFSVKDLRYSFEGVFVMQRSSVTSVDAIEGKCTSVSLEDHGDSQDSVEDDSRETSKLRNTFKGANQGLVIDFYQYETRTNYLRQSPSPSIEATGEEREKKGPECNKSNRTLSYRLINQSYVKRKSKKGLQL